MTEQTQGDLVECIRGSVEAGDGINAGEWGFVHEAYDYSDAQDGSEWRLALEEDGSCDYPAADFKLLCRAGDMATCWAELQPLTDHFGSNDEIDPDNSRAVSLRSGFIRVFRPDIDQGDNTVRLLAEVCTDDPAELLEAHNKLTALQQYIAACKERA